MTAEKIANRRQRSVLRWLLRIGGTLLLLFFLWRLKLDPAQILQNLASANGWLVGLAVVLVFPFIGLKAWRWQIILQDLGVPISFGAAYRLYAVGLAAGSFTPGQAGDAIKAWYLRDLGYALGPALLSIVLDRLFDVAVLLLLAIGGLLFLGNDFVGELPALLFLLGGTLVAVIALSVPTWRNRLLNFARSKVHPPGNPTGRGSKFKVQSSARDQSDGPKLTHRATRRAEVQSYDAELEAQAEELAPDAWSDRWTLDFGFWTLLYVFGATLLGSGLALFRIWLLALALGMNLNPLEVVAVSSLATVVSLIPISVGGIGARDITLVGILSRLGYTSEKAFSLSTLILLLNLVNLIAGYVIWFTRPKEMKDNLSPTSRLKETRL